MKPNERFEQVKRNLISWANDCEADPQDAEDIKWLIARVKKLTEALESINKYHQVGSDVYEAFSLTEVMCDNVLNYFPEGEDT